MSTNVVRRAHTQGDRKLNTKQRSFAGPNDESAVKRVLLTLRLFPTLPDEALINLRVVCALLGRSPASIWRDIEMKRFSAPVKVGHSTRWRVGEIREYLARCGGGE
jgi:predicted DNA-binding transcriptional regulator AlpA